MRKFIVASLSTLALGIGGFATHFFISAPRAYAVEIDQGSTTGTMNTRGTCILCPSGKQYKKAEDGKGSCTCWSCCS